MNAARYRPEVHHTELGGDFFDEVEPATFPKHELRHRNDRWAERVGLAQLDDDAWKRHFGAFEPLSGNLERPLALRYHGHQFRSYNPDLGDGRGFLFAQLRDVDGRLLDLGTKGSGQTPWSRGGDGRLTLKGGVREVLATALLEALGVYTSKSFSLVETGEALQRGDEPSPTRSSVLVRLSHSHVRFGSFQRQTALDRVDNGKRLLDYAIHYYLQEDTAFEGVPPEETFDAERARSDAEWSERSRRFLTAVLERSARLAASWMAAGFVHGVLNTDNLNVTGESFDYGPYRFLPTLDPDFTAAYFDQTGLYCYGRQPEAVVWNLTRLAETLLPFASKDELVAVLETYGDRFQEHYLAALFERLGLARSGEAISKDAPDVELANAVTEFLHDSDIGFERFFFDWYGGGASEERAMKGPARTTYESEPFATLRRLLADRTPASPEALGHPYFASEDPCTLLYDEIEALWEPIADRDDWSRFDAKLASIEEMRQALRGELP